MVATDLGLLPRLVHPAVQGGPDLAMDSGQGQQPAYVRQLTGSGLYLEFNPSACTSFDDVPLHTVCAWAEEGLIRERISLSLSYIKDTELFALAMGFVFGFLMILCILQRD